MQAKVWALEVQVSQLEHENSSINYLTRVVELNDKLEAEDIIANYDALKIKHEAMRKAARIEITSLKRELASVKMERDETLVKM